MRFLPLFLLPFLGAVGAFGDLVPDDATVAILFVISAIAALANCFASRPGKRCGMLIFMFFCMFLYGVQLLVLLYPRILKSAGDQLSHHEYQQSRPISGSVPQFRGLALNHNTTVQHTEPAHAIVAQTFGGKIEARKMHTISVVFPCAEEAANALNTVERFCTRTPEDQLAEIIVVDDGSSPPMTQLFAEDSRRLDKDPRCKLRILRHSITIGLMAAKLTGGKAAIGDVVAFFDCHCSPKLGWHEEILSKVTENPRRMVVPAITDIDMDTFDERKDSAVNAKCYLTFDADFKWFDDESDYIPTISGGLVAMGREWFNLTGGFDEEMHGWGGENLDQSLRAWLCGGEIMRAKSSRIAHMWRTGDPRTRSNYIVKAKGTNNRGRCAAAWFDAFLPVYRGSQIDKAEVQNYDVVKQRLGCKPFSYFLYRFRKVYIEGGVIARTVFHLQDKTIKKCLTRRAGTTQGANCEDGSKSQRFQLGNVDRKTAKCCSGLRAYGSNDCLDYFDGSGPHWYSCDVTGQNGNQQYRLRKDGRIQHGESDCILMDKGGLLQQVPCESLNGEQGVFEKLFSFEPTEWQIYSQEIKLHRYAEELPDLPDN